MIAVCPSGAAMSAGPAPPMMAHHHAIADLGLAMADAGSDRGDDAIRAGVLLPEGTARRSRRRSGAIRS